MHVVKSRIELRAADSMPPRYIAAYVQLVKSVFGSPAALQNVLRHYRGRDHAGHHRRLSWPSARTATTRWVYGRPVSGELAWLLMQARSRTPSQEERALLDPFMQLADRPSKSRSARRKSTTNKPVLSAAHTDPERGYAAMRETSYHAVIAEMTVRALWETAKPDGLHPRRAVGPAATAAHRCGSTSTTPCTSLDQWFINPQGHRLCRAAHPHAALAGTARFTRQCVLTDSAVDDYFYTIKAKLSIYLTSLHDEDLLQRPDNCEWTRFTLILSQYRHLYTPSWAW